MKSHVTDHPFHLLNRRGTPSAEGRPSRHWPCRISTTLTASSHQCLRQGFWVSDHPSTVQCAGRSVRRAQGQEPNCWRCVGPTLVVRFSLVTSVNPTDAPFHWPNCLRRLSSKHKTALLPEESEASKCAAEQEARRQEIKEHWGRIKLGYEAVAVLVFGSLAALFPPSSCWPMIPLGLVGLVLWAGYGYLEHRQQEAESQAYSEIAKKYNR